MAITRTIGLTRREIIEEQKRMGCRSLSAIKRYVREYEYEQRMRMSGIPVHNNIRYLFAAL